jgi:hypothetical protein
MKSNRVQLSSAHEGVYFDQITRPNNPCYNLCALAKLSGHFDVNLFKQAINLAVVNFDMLSVGFEYEQEHLVQVFGHYNDLKVSHVSFEHEQDPEDAAQQHHSPCEGGSQKIAE